MAVDETCGCRSARLSTCLAFVRGVRPFFSLAWLSEGVHRGICGVKKGGAGLAISRYAC